MNETRFSNIFFEKRVSSFQKALQRQVFPMKCCLKQKLASKHRSISKECFICRMAYEYQIILRWCLKSMGKQT